MQVPVKLGGISGRYATALYVAATKAGTAATVEKELITVRRRLHPPARVRSLHLLAPHG